MNTTRLISLRPTDWLAWSALLIALLGFVAYGLHDLYEPFAFGHVRWSNAYLYWFARAHLDLGLATTHGLNVEGVTGSGEAIFYLSHPPLAGLMQAAMVSWMGGEFWTVRLLPLLFNLFNAGLVTALAWRLAGPRLAPLAGLLFLGMPFIVEYGTSNESYQAYAMSAGMSGYLVYLRFLENRRWPILFLALCCFSLGMGFTWLGGFMALAMLAHFWLQAGSRREKLFATLLVGATLGSVALILLMQQGLVADDFFYPLKRALERSNAPTHAVVTWGDLIKLQSSRYFNYFGPVVSLLSTYWLLRRIVPRRDWRAADTWALLIWMPGLIYGFLLRDVAQQHDFLMLGLAPGAALMALLGVEALIRDISSALRWRGATLAGVAVAALLGTHALGAYRSAQSFEAQEAIDLERGAARVALYLREESPDTLLAATATARMTTSRDSRDGVEYASLLPFLDYLVRRPVRAVDDLEMLRTLACDATRSGHPLLLLRTDATRQRDTLEIPPAWIASTHGFDQVVVTHLAAMPPTQCPAGSDSSK